jgi:diguanylate cyclase (GGDEF)-like protein
MTQSDRNRQSGSHVLTRSTIRFVAPVLVSLTLMLIAAVISLEMLSTIRAYVGGESLYSKGQKSAIFYLARYAGSHSEVDFRLYQAAIAFPLGDRQARLALQRRPVDLEAARRGFLQAGNDPADIPSIVLLFRMFGNFGLMHDAVEIWTEGDGYTLRLCALADRLHSANGSRASVAQLATIRSELDTINRELTPLSARFSYTLGKLARTARTLLVLALTGSTLITGLLCIQVTRARVNERLAKERGLARLTELYAALSKTSQLISRVSDRRQLFDELCRICIDTTGLSLAAVGLVREDRGGVDFQAAHGHARWHLPDMLAAVAPHSELRSHALHVALDTGRAHVIHRDRGSAGSTPFLSEASFPLTCQARTVGVLCVFSQEEHFFGHDIVELMEQLAMEASFALEGLYRESERHRQAQILANQNRILNLIASGADLEFIFAALAELVETQCSGVRCALAALDAGGNWSLVAAPTLPPGFGQALAAAGHLECPAPGARGPSGAGAAANLTSAVRPLDASLRGQIGDSGPQYVTTSLISGSQNQVLGALSLYSDQHDVLRDLDIRLIGICTGLAGIAIEGYWAADRIQHLAHHDDLTGLPNRLLFNSQLEQALARAQRLGSSVALLFLDLDRFKVINDTLGHAAGDSVLKQIAEHLRACLHGSDLLARVGGDEFTLVVEHSAGIEELGVISQKLLAAISGAVTVNGAQYQLSGSIGIAIYPKDGSDAASLLKNADIAMYRAKSSGRDTYQFYANEIDVHSIERLALENELRQAVQRREFEVHYQPKVDIASGRIAGAEALVRWRHPQRGLLLPGEFIFVAEEVGLIGAIGNIVLETVCRDLARWRRAGLPPTRIAINLSAQQFADARLLGNLDRVLHETGCDPQLLEFEITESVMMMSPDKALQLLEHIKTYGITLAIDDFGTGHSSLAYLKRFPVDSIKIDNTFVRDIAADPDDLAITKGIIALGHSLALKVIAEGVESQAQFDILRRHRCDEFQGFLFSAAIPAAEFGDMLLGNPRALHGARQTHVKAAMS